MDGDVAPLSKDLRPRRTLRRMTYVDEVHAVGMYGPRGGGIAEREGVMAPHRRHRGHARQGLRRARRLHRRQFRDHRRRAFLCAGLHLHDLVAARDLLPQRPPRSDISNHQRGNANATGAGRANQGEPDAAGLPVMVSPHAYRSDFRRRSRALQAGQRYAAHDHDIYIQPINYPTVAQGIERLRITPSPYHDDALIDQLAEALLQVWERLGLPLQAKSMAAE